MTNPKNAVEVVREALGHRHRFVGEALDSAPLEALATIEAVIEASRFFVMPGVVVHPTEWRRRAQVLSDALSKLEGTK